MTRLAADPEQIATALRARGCVTPALVIDLAQVERNIAAMIAHLGGPERWRPHVKTIKQARIVTMLLAAGVRHFKCATIPELRMVVDAAARFGADVDVLLAYPIARARIGELVALAHAAPHATIGVTGDDPDHLEAILDADPRSGPLVGWIDVDVGMHRTGSPAATWLRWAERARRPIAGVHAYEGHLGWDDRAAAAQCYGELGALVRAVGPCRWLVTSGSLAFDHALASPSLRPGDGDGDGDGDRHGWLHQIGAGTLVLVDVASTVPARSIGAAPSTYVAARVVARPGPGRITLDAGSKALAPDRPPPNCTVLGKPDWRPQRPSEEHLPVLVDDRETPARDEIVLLVPDHVCTTVNLYREAIYLRDGVPCGRGPIDAGGREAQPDAAPEGGPHLDGASR